MRYLKHEKNFIKIIIFQNVIFETNQAIENDTLIKIS